MSVLQWIIIILAGIWVVFEGINLVMWISRKIKTRKYIAKQLPGQGSVTDDKGNR